jgi:hypothetical protein
LWIHTSFELVIPDCKSSVIASFTNDPVLSIFFHFQFAVLMDLSANLIFGTQWDSDPCFQLRAGVLTTKLYALTTLYLTAIAYFVEWPHSAFQLADLLHFVTPFFAEMKGVEPSFQFSPTCPIDSRVHQPLCATSNLLFLSQPKLQENIKVQNPTSRNIRELNSLHTA